MAKNVVIAGKKGFAERLRAAREAAGVSAASLAGHFGLTVKAVYAWESTKAGVPDALKLKGICRMLGTTADALLWGPEDSDRAIGLSSATLARISRLNADQMLNLERAIAVHLDAVLGPEPTTTKQLKA